MPKEDGSGPFGRGARTGRGLGYCTGYDRPGFPMGRGGRFMGRGFGRGRGPGIFFPEDPEPHQQISEDEEKEYLKRSLIGMEKDLIAIKSRLKELEE